ncbi:4Fe-4S dicluster domain-containing protein [Schleiferia thermophila]|uniref:4Fe-4S dicluster protein n=1 Tax=Schleiferia thermophila TaxID=884107 RepID=A0A369A1P9_9FLAO|nr:4Fe-4S dicluster domain-containing protein [Schleiferia thermophila]RCX03220.1 4Fe-4S dicluster protein [Schleiferia thermophila]GCD80347.1 Fe-S oxidoreductase [Schleiferia thermophila]
MSFGLSNVIFLLALFTAIYFFAKNVKKIRRNILLARDSLRTDQPATRWKIMTRVALGQSKMVVNPVAGLFHIVIYAGFLLINIEVLEIVLDGILGTHRLFAQPLGALYTAAINFFEILAVAVIVACVVFLWRRNVMKIDRFRKPELQGWPFRDANYILIIEIVLMIALLSIGAAEANMENPPAGPFIISSLLAPVFSGLSQDGLHIAERIAWWAHILGILAFLNYLPFSKHFHIILSFPNTWYAKLTPYGKFPIHQRVKKEVELMLDPHADPYTAPSDQSQESSEKFGAKDVMDLTWVNVLNAYACTECGRCTAECPANQTGKKLSPRKIMMDVRDRAEEIGRIIDANGGKFVDDGKSLLDHYITREEIWACTSCNACVEACPVLIDPLDIIMQLRQYVVMEEAKAPQSLNLMMTNVENNGAPWQFAQADRANWVYQ